MLFDVTYTDILSGEIVKYETIRTTSKSRAQWIADRRKGDKWYIHAAVEEVKSK